MHAMLLPHKLGSDPWDDHIWTAATGPQLSASLLARLSEAADGKRDGAITWLVGQLVHDFQRGHKVLGYYTTPEEAFKKNMQKFDANPSRDKYKIFGPFLTRSDGSKEKQVASVKLTMDDGTEVCLNGTDYDAIFWSESAFDKFVAPYYVQVGDLYQAMLIRAMFLDPAVIAAIHIPGSEIIEGDGSGSSPCPPPLIPDGDKTLGLHVLTLKPGGGAGGVLNPV